MELRAERLESRAKATGRAALAVLRSSLPVRAIRGRVGDVVFKTYGRKIVVARVPSFAGVVPSAAQRAQRSRLREATAYAKRVYADPVAKGFYIAAARELGRQPFRLAIADYLAGHARLQVAGELLSRGRGEETVKAERVVPTARAVVEVRPVVRRPIERPQTARRARLPRTSGVGPLRHRAGARIFNPTTKTMHSKRRTIGNIPSPRRADGRLTLVTAAPIRRTVAARWSRAAQSPAKEGRPLAA